MTDTQKKHPFLPIEQRIFTIRGLQVMLDSDLAELYGVETKVLNQAVKRNDERFPETFRFKLTNFENDELISCGETSSRLRSQSVTLESNRGKHRKYLPFVFTEQGVAMLSAVLRSDTAIAVSIRIMQAFVVMRNTLRVHIPLIQRVERLEEFKNDANKRIDLLFNALEDRTTIPDKGIFFNGQVFDAWVFVSDLVRSAEISIVLIDNFVDDTVLKLFVKRKEGIAVMIFTRQVTPELALEADKFNQQYGGLSIRQLSTCHDRFLIIDDKVLYHIGASLKDLGKKWFAFSRIDSLVPAVLQRLKD